MKKIIVAMLLVIAFAFAAAGCGNNNDANPGFDKKQNKSKYFTQKEVENLLHWEKTDSIVAIDNGESYFPIVSFGTYEQDAILENGVENIDWYILTETEDSYLLLSKYILDKVCYKSGFNGIDMEEYAKSTWEVSDLRAWLNDVFYNEAFTEEEKTYIIETQISNAENNYFNGSKAGNDTVDNIFILSNEEMDNLFRSSEEGYRPLAVCFPTKYCVSNRILGLDVADGAILGTRKRVSDYTGVQGLLVTEWWVRSTHNTSGNLIAEFGQSASGIDGLSDGYGVRPSFWISKKAVEENVAVIK